MPLAQFVEILNPERPVRVPGTAIFMARDLHQVPSALLHALKHNKALHERVVMMQVDTEDVPHVLDDRRLEIAEVGKGFYTMRVRYGFMDEPNIMRALALWRVQHFHINLMDTSFYIGREKLRTRGTGFLRWRDWSTEKPGCFEASISTFSRRVRRSTASGILLTASGGITTAPCRSAWMTSLGETTMPPTVTVPPNSTR